MRPRGPGNEDGGGTEEPSVMLSAHLIFHEQLLGGVAPHTPPT